MIGENELLEKLREVNKIFLGVNEAAELVGLHNQTIRKYLKRGELPYVRISKKILILPKDLADFLMMYRSKPRH